MDFSTVVGLVCPAVLIVATLFLLYIYCRGRIAIEAERERKGVPREPCMGERELRRNWIIVLAVGAFVTSIVYSPHRIMYVEEKVDRPYYNILGAGSPPTPSVTRIQHDRVEYALMWEAPANSSLEFGRLVVTWLAISAVGAVLLYINHNSKDRPVRHS